MRKGGSDAERADSMRNAAAGKQKIGECRFEANGYQRSMIAIGG